MISIDSGQWAQQTGGLSAGLAAEVEPLLSPDGLEEAQRMEL